MSSSLLLIVAFIFFLLWGSFLNVVAYRLIRGQSLIRPRSYCIHCRHTLAWYDLIPIISWVTLKGRCRYCHQKISSLYPFIELLTASLLLWLFIVTPSIFFFSYFIFFSALIITVRSDIETMLISRYVTIYLLPVAYLLSAFKLLPISTLESIIGSAIGYGLLYLASAIFRKRTGKEGMGQGDLDLLAFIGGFIGIYGCWVSLLIGSIAGSIIGSLYILIFKHHARNTRIPFGPFLSFGAISFILFKETLLKLIFKI